MFKSEAKSYLYELEKSVTDSYKKLLKARENLKCLDELGFNGKKMQKEIEKMQKEIENLGKFKNENLDFCLNLLKDLENN